MNMCLISIKFVIVDAILGVTVFNLYNNNLFMRYSYRTTIRYSSYNLLVSTNTCSLDLYADELQTTIVFFTRNFTQGRLNSH